MRFIAILTTTVLLAGCQQPQSAAPVDWSAARAAIETVEKAQIAALVGKDAATSAAAYSKDAVLIGDDGKIVTGRESVVAMFTKLVADPNLKLDYRPGAKVFSADGSMAYSTAAYTESYTDSATGKAKTVEGSNLSVWRKDADGSWKLVADSNPASVKP